MNDINFIYTDAGKIAEGDLDQILALIWHLIRKYQLSMPNDVLLAWVKSKMPPGIPMNNFTTHWNDGRAIAVLVDAVEPGLYPEVHPEDLDPEDAENNAKKAIETAETYLGIPAVSFQTFFWQKVNNIK